MQCSTAGAGRRDTAHEPTSHGVNAAALSSDSLRPLLPPTARGNLHLHLPSHRFEVSYDLKFTTLCTDFQGNVEFQFSLGWTALVNRFLGPANTKRAVILLDESIQVPMTLRCPRRKGGGSRSGVSKWNWNMWKLNWNDTARVIWSCLLIRNRSNIQNVSYLSP